MADLKPLYMLDALPADHPTRRMHTELMNALRRGVGGYPYAPAEAGAIVRAKFNQSFGTDIPNCPFDRCVEQMYGILVEKCLIIAA